MKNLLKLYVSLFVGLTLAITAMFFISPTVYADGPLCVRPGGGDGGNCACSDPNQHCRSVQRAINVAAPGDTIRVAEGDYAYDRNPDVAYVGANGLIDIEKEIVLQGGWNISFTARHPSRYASTLLDGERARRVIHITGDITPTVDGFMVTKGAGAGAGVYVLGAHPVLRNLTITENRGLSGNGGLNLNGADRTKILNSIIRDNEASRGGGIYIGNSADVLLQHVTIRNNEAHYGGGVYSFDSSLIFRNVNALGNQGKNSTGGLELKNVSNTIFENVLIQGNRAPNASPIYPSDGHYGGLYLSGDNVRLTNVTIARNSAAGHTGGAYIESNGAVLDHVKVLTNTASHRAGMILTGHNPNVSHLTVAGNLANDGDYGAVTMNGNNASLSHVTVNNNQSQHYAGLILNGNNSTLEYITSTHNIATNRWVSALRVAGNSTNNSVTIKHALVANNSKWSVSVHSPDIDIMSVEAGRDVNSSVVLQDIDIIENNSGTRLWVDALYVSGHSPQLSNIRVMSNTIGYHALDLRSFGEGALVEQAVVKNNQGFGVALSNFTNGLMHRSLVANNARDGIRVSGNNARLENNVVVGNGDRGILGSGDNLQLVHNTIVGNMDGEGPAIYLGGRNHYITNTLIVSYEMAVQVSDSDTSQAHVTIDNSIFSNSGSPGYTPLHRVTANTIRYCNPAFVNPAEQDYRLAPHTGCAIDFGNDAGAYLDFEGDARPADNGYDIGADEYAPGVLISKTATDINGGALYAGDLIRYTIQVTNEHAFSSQTNLHITDTLPAGVAFISAEPAGYSRANSLVWALDSLDVGQVWTAVITAQVDGTANPIGGNVLRVNSDQQNEDSTQPIYPPAPGGGNGNGPGDGNGTVAPGLTIEKVAQDLNGGELYAGDTLLYTVTVTNAHLTQTMTNVRITDTLPAGVAFISAEPAGYSEPSSVVWMLDSLAVGEVFTAVITVQVDGTANPIGGNVLSVSSDQQNVHGTQPVYPPAPGGDDGNGNGDGDGTVAPGLTLEKVAQDINGGALHAGDILVYTIAVTNAHLTQIMTNVRITDTLPAGVAFISAQPASYSGSNPLVWMVDSLAVGEVFTAVITVQVDGTANPIGGNILSVSSDQQNAHSTQPVYPPAPGGDDGNGSSDGDGTVAPGLTLEKVAQDLNGGALYAGDILVYTLTVTNGHLTQTMTNVRITDTLPAGVAFISAEPAGYIGPNSVVWMLDSLAVGEVFTAVITVQVDGTANPIGGNILTVSSDQQNAHSTQPVYPPAPGGDNGSGGSDGDGTVAPGLTLEKVAQDLNGGALYAGDMLVYTITVTNAHLTQTMTNLYITDTLPAGVAFISAEPAGYIGPNSVVWMLDSLAVGEVFTAVITVQVDGTANPIGGNILSVSSDQQNAHSTQPVYPPAPGGDDGNGGSDGDGTVAPGLTIEKVAEDINSGSLFAGDILVYTLTVTNGHLTQTMTNVRITDTLPAGVAFISAEPAGYSGSDSIVWMLDSLGVGEVFTAVITVQVDGTANPIGGNILTVSSDQQNAHSTQPVYPPAPGGDNGNGGSDGDGTVAPGLTIEKVAEDINSGSLFAGDILVYTITVTNGHLTQTMTNVRITDTLPAGVSFISAEPAGYSGSDSIVWMLDSLGVGEVFTAVITVQVDGTANPIGGNILTVSSEQQNAHSTQPVYPSGGGEFESPTSGQLEVIKTATILNDNTGSANIDDMVQYVITVTNVSTVSTVTSVVVTDTLPAEVSFIMTSQSNYSGPNPLVWVVGDLLPGEQWVATILVQVTQTPLSGNVAWVSSDQNALLQTPPAMPNWEEDQDETIYLPIVMK